MIKLHIFQFTCGLVATTAFGALTLMAHHGDQPYSWWRTVGFAVGITLLATSLEKE